MFLPTQKGVLYTGQTFNGRGKEIPSNPVLMRYTPVRVRNNITKTSIRTDKSASQGRAEELEFDGRILVHPEVTPIEGQKCALQNGEEYVMEVVQEVYDSPGQLDHYQVDLLK